MTNRTFYITILIYSLIVAGYCAWRLAEDGKLIDKDILNITILLAFSPNLLSILFSKITSQAMKRSFYSSVIFAIIYSIVFIIFLLIRDHSEFHDKNIVESVSIILFNNVIGLFIFIGAFIGIIGMVVSGLIFFIKSKF